MVDRILLRDLSLISFRVHQLASDRGFSSECIDETDALVEEKAQWIFDQALERKCSLSEVVSKIFFKDDKRLIVEILDRNQDPSKKRIKMISTDQIKALKEKLSTQHLTLKDTLLVLSPNKWSPQAKKEDLSDLPNLTCLLFDDLLIRVPKHELQVPHVPISEHDLHRLVGPHVSPGDLPMIQKMDPVVRWFGFPSGTLLRIDRPGFLNVRCVRD